MSSENVVTIALMGSTGVGKTTFINRASGSSLAEGDDLNSCTSEIARSEIFRLNGRNVQLIDTPGFDDSSTPDTVILRKVALYLETEYQQGFKLSGIIFLHRISDVRVGGTSRRNFTMFRKLCGEQGFKNVVLATTRWSDILPDVGEKREQQLKSQDSLFRPALTAGARMVRYDNTRESALCILADLVNQQPMPMQLQEELVDRHVDISQTEAGTEVRRLIEIQATTFRNEIEELRREMRSSMEQREADHKEDIKRIRAEYEEKLATLVDSREKLSSEYLKDKQEWRRKERDLESARVAAEEAREKSEIALDEERRRNAMRISSLKDCNAKLIENLQELEHAQTALSVLHSAEKDTLRRKLDQAEKEAERAKVILEEERLLREQESRDAQERVAQWEKEVERERMERDKEREAMREREERMEREWEEARERERMREKQSKEEREREREQERAREHERKEAAERDKKAREETKWREEALKKERENEEQQRLERERAEQQAALRLPFYILVKSLTAWSWF